MTATKLAAVFIVSCVLMASCSMLMAYDELKFREQVTACMVGYGLLDSDIVRMTGDDLRDYIERSPSHGVADRGCAADLEIYRREVRK